MDLQQLIREASDIQASGLHSDLLGSRYELILKEICERDPINSQYVTQYADLLARKRRTNSALNAEEDTPLNKGNEIEEAQKVFERSLRYNSANVTLWQSYLQFNIDHLEGPEGEATTKGVFERAIQAVGKHMKSDQIWLMYIDFETQFMHWGFINLLFFMAAQTPLVKHEDILDRYLDTIENFHSSIIDDIQSGQFQLPDRYAEQYTELGKSQIFS